MNRNRKKLFGKFTEQQKPSQTDSVVPPETAEASFAPKTEEQPKRNKYADKMNRSKRKLGKGVRIGIAAAVVALLIGGGVFAVVKSRNAGTEDTTATTATVTYGDLETYIEGNGVTAAKKREELGKDIKGKVTEVLVAEGDEVHTGDKLVVVDPTETRKELTSAQKEMTEAERGISEAKMQVSKAQNRLECSTKKAVATEYYRAVYRQADSQSGFGWKGRFLPRG